MPTATDSDDTLAKVTTDVRGAVSKYLEALRQRASSINLLYESLKQSGPLPIEDQEVTTSILRTLKTYYDVENEIKTILGKRVRGNAADVFVETLLLYLRVFFETHGVGLTALSEKSISRKRGSIRPDISIWRGEQLIATIECKTNFGWNRHGWETYLKERERRVYDLFRSAKCFLVVLTKVNWPGFGSDPRVGDQLFTLCAVWPTDVSLDHPEASIRNPIEPLLRQLKQGTHTTEGTSTNFHGTKPAAVHGPAWAIDDPVMLIRINKLYRPGISSDDLYEVTRRAWKVGTRREAARIACAVFEGVVREVYEIGQWRKASPREGESWKGNRWEFVGNLANESVRSKYLGHPVKSHFTRGARNPIAYVNC